MIKKPATTCYGHLFEHAAIKEWVAEKGKCPLTQKPLRPNQIFPQYSVKTAIDEMRKVSKELEEQRAEIARLKAIGSESLEEEKKDEVKPEDIVAGVKGYDPFDAKKAKAEDA